MAGTEKASIQSGPLPVELITEIIALVAGGLYTKFDQLNPYVLKTLAAASLVSRTWNTICRSHILHTLPVLNFHFNYERLRFLHFDAPHLCTFIRKVLLGRDDFCTTAGWFPAFAARLTNLRELVLDNPASPGNGGMVPESLPACLFTAPRLRKLVFRYWNSAVDGSDVLSVLSATIEELSFENMNGHNLSDLAVQSQSTVSVRLEALRSLEFKYTSHLMLGSQNPIECPNLQRFTFWTSSKHPWTLPPWVPTSFSELTLHARMSRRALPDFGTAIRPSVVTIHLLGTSDSYFDFFYWIQHCIRSLPSPGSVKTLNIHIINNLDYDYGLKAMVGLYPDLEDYEMFSRFLHRLWACEGGSLKAIALDIRPQTEHCKDDMQVSKERRLAELAKLKKGFAPLLEAHVLNVDYIIERPEFDTSIQVMRCSIHTRV
ncbi:hypothetical protein PTI98_009561 [Pleurotus ostreatus]|nr:hypothetical protein PTI98_009561 [Pleurotus ostreatus]